MYVFYELEDVIPYKQPYLIESTMVNVINLNKKKKAKARVEKEKKASENRIKFGRTKKEKQMEKQEIERDKRHLDGHKLEKKETEE